MSVDYVCTNVERVNDKTVTNQRIFTSSLFMQYEYLQSTIPITSLQLCIESCGIPASTVLIPVFAARTGPMVVPQGQSFLTTNSCTGGKPAVHDGLSKEPKLLMSISCSKVQSTQIILYHTN